MKTLWGGRTGRMLLASTALAAIVPAQVLAAEVAEVLPEIVVTAIVPADTRLIAGAHDVIERADIEARAPLSLRDQLIAIPGVAVIEEDAGGLAINIGVRGLDPRRSARTLLMEDGVPLFLAPYADPAAHYAPPVERVERIEVVRGSGQILHGPQTVGGMINFVTTPVPTKGLLLRAEARAGNTDFLGLQGAVGTGNERMGVLLEATAREGDGIRTGHDFGLWELVGKARVMIGANHELKLRASHYRERSAITEVMLGTREWADDPLQAPTAGQDRFEMDRTHLQASHIWTASDQVRLVTTGYWVNTHRASFRQTNTPGAWGDESDERGLATGWSVLDRCFDEDDPQPGTGGSAANRITPAAAAACGGRWRPRRFHYYGVEPRLDASHTLFGAEHQTTLGARWHQERVQRDQFRSPDPAIQDLDFALGLTGGAHREDAGIRVRAWSAYVQDSMTMGAVTITAGLRLEDVRTVTTIRRASGRAANVTVEQNDTALLPGLGAVWRVGGGTEIFAGVHSGFAPPRPSRDIGSEGPAPVAPERSTNWEFGVRSQPRDGITLAATLFRTDFREIVISSAVGRFINGGRSRQQGLEMSGRIDSAPITGSRHNVWLQTAWTFLPTAKFLTTSDAAFNSGDGGIIGAPCDDGDGCVNGNGIIAGSRLAYAARHAVSATLGYRHPAGVEARVGLDHRSAQQPDPFARVLDTAINAVGCSDATCSGLAGPIPAVTLINAGLSFTPGEGRVTLFATGWNLADRRYLATRVDGMGAGRARTIVGGVRFRY
ncbi:TonB-dependent receptor family protein [Sandarakinorhabdus sp.]|uniref:TonB-dependent receptor family protein n=1 Tax=Sandarakinorhabdus sp. TaxID=1916663 RepID=UPI003F727324